MLPRSSATAYWYFWEDEDNVVRARQEISRISRPGARIWLGEVPAEDELSALHIYHGGLCHWVVGAPMAMDGDAIVPEHNENGSQLLCGKRNLAYQFLTPTLLQAGSIPTTRRAMWPATEVLLKAHPFTQGSRGGIALPLQLSIHEAGRIRASHCILTFRFPSPGI